MIKKAASIFSALIMSSCTTFEDIDQGLSMLKGRPIDDLIGILGFPDGEQNILDRRLVFWTSSQYHTIVTPVTNYSYGSGTITNYVPSTVNYNCTIRVQIDSANRIIGHDFEGNIEGCEIYAQAIRNALPVSTGI